MPHGNRLTNATVRSLKTPGRHADGNGLYLQVRSGSRGISKSWILRYMPHGTAHTMGLGPLSLVSLAEARFAATEAQKQRFHGVDPLEAKQQAQVVSEASTFKQAAKTYIAIHEPNWKNKKHVTQRTNTLKEYAEPIIGKRPVDRINRGHILSVNRPGFTGGVLV